MFFTPDFLKDSKLFNSLNDHPLKLFGVSFYYSIVTITTLGFGDISPNNMLSMVLTVSESVMGIIIIGFFLNAVAIKIAEDIEEEKKNKKMKKICMVLEPLLKTHLDTLTTMKSSSSIKGKEVPIFSDKFIEEIVLLCGNAEFQQSIPRMSVAKFFALEFEKTQKKLKGFINRFITLIDDDFLFLLNKFAESNTFEDITRFERKHQNSKQHDIYMAGVMDISESEKQKMIEATLSQNKQPIPLFIEWMRTGNNSEIPLEACSFYNHIKILEKIVIEVEKVLERKIEFQPVEWVDHNYSIILTDANPGVYLNYDGELLY